MKRIMTTAILAAALSLSAAPIAYAQDNPMVGGAEMPASRNIVENAVNSADHTTLVAAVKAAGLVETLSGEGPFTVFAPTNAAFDKLPEGTVENLLKPENKDQLTKILTCHVVAANAMASDIQGMVADDGGAHPVKTVGGCTFTAKVENGEVKIEDGQGNVATVTIPDVKQSNGVIHVVDTVLLPADDSSEQSSDASSSNASQGEGQMSGSSDQAMANDSGSDAAMSSDMAGGGDNPMVGGAPMYANKTIVENAVNSKDHTTLVAAVKAAGLVETLSGDGPFTVFAPVNAAFEKLPAGTVDTLLKPENKDQLTKVLTAHVVPGKLSEADLRKNIKSHGGTYNMETASGDALTAMIKNGDVWIFDESGTAGKVTIADVNQSNGVIQVVDTVLVPK